jgi:hypothetical protein
VRGCFNSNCSRDVGNDELLEVVLPTAKYLPTEFVAFSGLSPTRVLTVRSGMSFPLEKSMSWVNVKNGYKINVNKEVMEMR